MGGNGNGYLPIGYGLGTYLGSMSDFYTRGMRTSPACYWPARDYTSAWEGYNYHISQPYGMLHTYVGKPYYTVADSFQVPYSLAMSAQGFRTAYSPDDIAATLQNISLQNGMSALAKQTGADLSKIQTIGQWKNEKVLKDEPELKEKIIELEKKAKALLEQLEKVMKNEDGKLSAVQMNAKIKAISEAAAPLYKEAEAIHKELNELQAKLVQAEAEAAQEEVEDIVDDDGDDAGDTDPAKVQREAKADFRKAYAEATGGTYDSSKTYKPFPEEITYSADKKEYKVTVEGKTFTGKDFAELDKKISKSTDENIKDKWAEIKEELLEETGKTRRPAKRREEYTPKQEQTSDEKTEVTEKGTKVKVKNKKGQPMAGKYYEYKGKIYKIEKDQAKPIDVTDSVEKQTA